VVINKKCERGVVTYGRSKTKAGGNRKELPILSGLYVGLFDDS